MKQVAGQLRLDLAQYRELAAFAQFASDLDRRTRELLERGQRMTELLKQPQYEPVPLGKQIVSLFTGTRGYLDDVAIDRVSEFEHSFLRYMEHDHAEIEKAVVEQGKITDEIERDLRAAIDSFKKDWAG
jgi:F-type H+-transporting ATPase subunit alpha